MQSLIVTRASRSDQYVRKAVGQLLTYKKTPRDLKLYNSLLGDLQNAIAMDKTNTLAYLLLAITYQLRGLRPQANEYFNLSIGLPIDRLSQPKKIQTIISDLLFDLAETFKTDGLYDATISCLSYATKTQEMQIEFNRDLLRRLEATKDVPLTDEESATHIYRTGLDYIASGDYPNATQCVEKLITLASTCSEENQHHYCIMAKELFDKIPKAAVVITTRYNTHDILHTLLCAQDNPSANSVTEKTPSTSPVTVRIDSSLSTGCDSIRTTRMKVGEDEELYPLSFFTEQKKTEGSEMAEEDLVTYKTPNDDDDSVGRISPTA